MPSIEEGMTDNHWSYTHSTAFAEALTSLGASHIAIRTHCPRLNEKVERLQPDTANRMGLPASHLQQ